jgi:hypothetical protein
MRQIADAIQAMDEDKRAGTANHETIRRTLRGEAVGAWQTVEVIFLALCELADVDPNDADDVEDNRDTPVPHIESLQRAWNHAVDEAPMPDRPKTRKERADEAAAQGYATQRPLGERSSLRCRCRCRCRWRVPGRTPVLDAVAVASAPPRAASRGDAA